jgi:hypothetical protein
MNISPTWLSGLDVYLLWNPTYFLVRDIACLDGF